MHLEAEQYAYVLEKLATAIPRWQEDIEKYAATIDKYRAEGKAVAGMEINLNYQVQRVNLVIQFIEASQGIVKALENKAKENRSAPVPIAENTAASGGREVIRDMPVSMHGEVLYTQELILGLHEWVTGIDYKLNQLQQTITPHNGKKRGD